MNVSEAMEAIESIKDLDSTDKRLIREILEKLEMESYGNGYSEGQNPDDILGRGNGPARREHHRNG